MARISRLCLAAMAAMVVMSFSNVLGRNIAGISVLIGVVVFFINQAVEHETPLESGLDIKRIKADLRGKGIWLWFFLPLFMDGVSISLAKLFLPEYIEHVLERTSVFVSYDVALLMLVQLIVLALGEEIAWRAFFQRQLGRLLPTVPVLLFSSLLFAIGHVAAGHRIVVLYDVFFVFINSMLYGILFHKTNNAWVSAASHFTANLFSIIALALL